MENIFQSNITEFLTCSLMKACIHHFTGRIVFHNPNSPETTWQLSYFSACCALSVSVSPVRASRAGWQHLSKEHLDENGHAARAGGLSVNVWTKLKCHGVLCRVPHVFKCSHRVSKRIKQLSPYIHWWFPLGPAGFDNQLIRTLHDRSAICAREVLELGELQGVSTNSSISHQWF